MNIVVTASVTQDYQLRFADSGTIFHNTNPNAPVTFTLPPKAYAGLNYAFAVAEPQMLTVKPAPDEDVAAGAVPVSPRSWQSNVIGSYLAMYCKLVNNIPYWFMTSVTGAWQLI